MSKFDAVDRLEGSKGDDVGGLIIKKKSGSKDDKETFKQPLKSLLGLQKLAEEKRRLNAEKERKESRKDNDDDDWGSKRKHHESRTYRSYKPETPSHPGGVSHDAQSKIQERYSKGKNKGVYADTREDTKKRDHEKYSGSSRDYYDDDRRSRDKKQKLESRNRKRRDRSPDSERGGRRTGSTKVGYEQWEDTPSRSERHGERSTPSVRSKGIRELKQLSIFVFW